MIRVECYYGSGHAALVGYDLSPAGTSKVVTLAAVTAAGVKFTPAGEAIRLENR